MLKFEIAFTLPSKKKMRREKNVTLSILDSKPSNLSFGNGKGAYQKTRSDACKARVLHASIREGWREDEDVVDAPLVRPAYGLCSRNHRINITELVSRPSGQTRLTPHMRTLSNVSEEDYRMNCDAMVRRLAEN